MEKIDSMILKNPEYDNLIYRNFDYLEYFSDRDDLFHGDGDHLKEEDRKAFSKLISSKILNILSEIEKYGYGI